MTQAMLLNWAVGRAQAAARAADSGVGSPRSPPPVSIQRGAAWGGAGGTRASAPGSGEPNIDGSRLFLVGRRERARAPHEGAPGLCPESRLQGRHLVLRSTLSGAGQRGAEGRGLEGRRERERGALPGARVPARPSAVLPICSPGLCKPLGQVLPPSLPGRP